MSLNSQTVVVKRGNNALLLNLQSRNMAVFCSPLHDGCKDPEQPGYYSRTGQRHTATSVKIQTHKNVSELNARPQVT